MQVREMCPPWPEPTEPGMNYAFLAPETPGRMTPTLLPRTSWWVFFLGIIKALIL